MQSVEIRVKGHIDQEWSDSLGGLAIAYTETGETILTGSVRDQSALLGLMNKLSGLGLRILSVASTKQEPSSHKEAREM